MEFRILGPVEVHVAGQAVDCGHARQRSVLAALLLDLGRAVPAERLIDRVWDEDPPASARNVLYSYVARLKSSLATAEQLAAKRPDGQPPASEPRDVTLTRRSGGYVLEAGPELVDLYRFRHLVAGAGAGGDEQAAALLRQAAGLWHGPALAGLSGGWLSSMRDALDLERRAAVLDLYDIELRRGRHRTLIGELSEAVTAHPTDERLVGQLMLALYRSGRQADALGTFERTRLGLAEDLGADPGPELRALHQQILRADPSLAGARPAGPERHSLAPATHLAGPLAAPGAAAGLTPRELPADVTGFTGRTAELAELDRLIGAPAATGSGADHPDGDPGVPRATAVVISAVSGTAGVGKTALALHWAHRAAWHFPDGQLYVNLRGYDPDQPLTGADALAGFLRTLGVPDADIPPGEDERAARFRSLLAGRRMLVVLDNARSAEQVRPLLPGAPTCRVLVTSRDTLAGLVVRDGARRLDLDLLPEAEAVRLLRAIVGSRVDNDPAAAASLVARCSRLPLALRVAAELAVSHPELALAELAADLSDQQTRLDLLDVNDDPRTAVRGVFSWSLRHLDERAVRAFALLGLHPGPDLDAPAAAALIGEISAEQAHHLLGQLARAHLIQPSGSRRYGQHDLLRAYARELAARDSAQAHLALTRLFDYYVLAASSAMDALYPAQRGTRPAPIVSGDPALTVSGPSLNTPGEARGWLDVQRAALVAAVQHAADGWPDHATRLAAIVFRYLDVTAHYLAGETVHAHACRAARQAGDPAAEAVALVNLGAVALRVGRNLQALDHFEQALAKAAEAGDLTSQARAQGNLGSVNYQLGRFAQAGEHERLALALNREIGDMIGQARTLVGLANVEDKFGQILPAIEHYQQALALSREAGDLPSQAVVLSEMARAEMDDGRYQVAGRHFREAIAVDLELCNPSNQAYSIRGLALIELSQGHCLAARSMLFRSLGLARQAGSGVLEGHAHHGLGETALALGQPAQALAHFAAALDVAVRIDDAHDQACAHEGLGLAAQAMGDPDVARRHWREALDLFTTMGIPAADRVRDRLAGLQPMCGPARPG